MSALIGKALAQMSQQRALLVGDLILDRYIYGNTDEVSREAPTLVVEQRSVESRLGGGGNTAANLSALGVQTTVLSALGTDSAAVEIRALLDSVGLDLAVSSNPSLKTPVKTRIMAGAYGRSKQQVLRVDDAPALPLPRTVQISVTDLLQELAPNADLVVVADYGLGIVDRQLIDAVVGLAKAGIPVCVDSRRQVRSFVGVSAVVTSVPEIRTAFGLPVRGEGDALLEGERLRGELHCDAVLMTRGKGGMTVFTSGGSASHVDSVGEHEVADVTGAGETVCATFASAIASGVGVQNAMRLANLAASSVVGKPGTVTAGAVELSHLSARYGISLEPWDTI